MKQFYLGMGFLLSMAFVQAQPLAVNSAEQQLTALLSELNSFSASFEQRVEEEDGYLLDKLQGIMSFDHPNRLYWRVLEPFPSTLVSDGEQVYLFDPDLNQVSVRPWVADPSQNPVALFVGEQIVADYYAVSKDGEEFLLQPLALNSEYRQIRLSFRQGRPSSMQIIDSLGQNTRIDFSTLKPGSLPEQPYRFDLPAGAEIVDDG